MIWEGREESLEKTTGGKKIEGKISKAWREKVTEQDGDERFKNASQHSRTKFRGKHHAIQGI